MREKYAWFWMFQSKTFTQIKRDYIQGEVKYMTESKVVNSNTVVIDGKEVTINKNTVKGILLEAYTIAAAEVEKLKETQLNPASIATEKKNKEVLTVANKTVQTPVVNIIENLRSAIENALSSVVNEFETKTKEFANLDEAIKVKNAELKEIYDIEKSANTLAALINAQQDLRKQQDEQNEETLASYRGELISIKEQINAASDEFEAQLKEQKARLKQEQQRDEAEFKYDFDRKKTKAEDEVADYIANQKKIIDSEKAILEAHEAEVTIREQAVEDLEAKVAEIPALIEAAREEAAEKARKDVEKSFVFEKRAIEAKKDADIQILTNKVDLLEQALVTEKEAHTKTASQLSEAYGRLENVAVSSVEGAKAQDTVTKLLTMNSEKSGK